VSVVLLVEDDQLLRSVLRASLHAWQFDVLESDTGEDALTLVANGAPDLVILDVNLPGIDGIETLRHLRSFTDVPVLVLTVRDGLQDKITALESGADDYMVKPFESEELRARTRAHLRRSRSVALQPAIVKSGRLEIDLAHTVVTWDGVPVALTPTELRLLEVLLANRGKLVTRERLLEAIWTTRLRSKRGNLRVTVLNLRRKLRDDAAKPELLLTEPGLRYRWIGGHEAGDELRRRDLAPSGER
jgi:two-component system KDP operon response regulator KdpE